MIFGLPAVVGAGLIGTAAFGIAKLAGASNKTALLAGLGTFGGMAALNALNPSMFGAKVAEESAKAAAGNLASAKTLADTAAATGTNITKLAQTGAVGAPVTNPFLVGATGVNQGFVAGASPVIAPGSAGNVAQAMTGTGITPPTTGGLTTMASTPAALPTPASTGIMDKAGDFIGNLSTAEKIGLGVGGASLLSSLNQPEQPPLSQQMPYSEADYTAAKARQDAAIEGMAGRADYSFEQPRTQSVYEPINPIYANEGGLISLAHFSEGGVNYLPSKTEHDEQDSNNYVRATGYVEDGSGNGDKDEDTMLAQLADGEFVSRADAILGAGIMSGASPKDFKDMRRKGAQFFYKQQDQLKRIYDIVNDANNAS